MRNTTACAAVVALLSLSACKTASSAVDGVKSAGTPLPRVSSVPSLVNVNLSNVLNNLALDLKIDKANIPINAQIPINIAANVCGVSINVLSIGAGGGSSSGCTANTISPELNNISRSSSRRTVRSAAAPRPPPARPRRRRPLRPSDADRLSTRRRRSRGPATHHSPSKIPGGRMTARSEIWTTVAHRRGRPRAHARLGIMLRLRLAR